MRLALASEGRRSPEDEVTEDLGCLDVGAHVLLSSRPELGVGRIVARTPLETRVLFLAGGLRSFTPQQARELMLTSATPAEARLLVALERMFEQIVTRTAPWPRASTNDD